MKKFSFLFSVIVLLIFLGFQNNTLAQSSASCTNGGVTYTVTAGAGSVTLSDPGITRVVLTRWSPYKQIEICHDSNSSNPSCSSSIITIAPADVHSYDKVEIYKNSLTEFWNPLKAYEFHILVKTVN